MSKVDETSSGTWGADVADRLRAVAAAPISLVDGVDAALIGDDEAAKKAGALAQAFEADVETECGADRVAALREEMVQLGIDGFVVPMADEYQNEYVPHYAKRIAWLSGFLGSAGTIIVLQDRAALFTDGRYTIQARDQVDAEIFETRGHLDIDAWLEEAVAEGQRIGYDPWLHTAGGKETLEKACKTVGATLVAVDNNPIDAVWPNQPPKPLARIVPHPIEFSGESAADKRVRITEKVKEANAQALVLSATDSIAWLLNIRGADVSRTPLALAYAVLHDDASVDLFVDDRKVDADLRAHLGNQVKILPEDGLDPTLDLLGADAKTVIAGPLTPVAITDRLEAAGAEVKRAADPCQLAKAIKNKTELDGTRAAHRRDGVALTKFLAWLDAEAPKGTVDELSAATQLQAFRLENENIRDLSFDTISGAGPNGAIVHYRVNEATNLKLEPGQLYLVDSGAQYLDGTTDVTRTVAIGEPTAEMRDRFTRVLKGHIALARARFPEGTTGSQLDVLARGTLWQAGLDFKHGTGHGVGSYLGVHEGPHSISPRPSTVALEAGMIVSNEPGYYKEGEYGIRVENLIAVIELEKGEDDARFFGFETLTLAPIDTRLIDVTLLSDDDIDWLNAYHARVRTALSERVDAQTCNWLDAATAPLTPPA
ncbi:MAG: aminopeptidase P family protein [Alphaproteobacteria bacterium]